MVSQPRWIAECRIMRNSFPRFRPFASNGHVGFRGNLPGRRTGRVYEVTMQASARVYPNYEPAIYINPHPEFHHWIRDGRLCYLREKRVWSPEVSTFASTLLVAVKYLAEFD